MFSLLFGHKTVAFFDIWSIEHFVAGISIGSLAFLYNRKKFGQLFQTLGIGARDISFHHTLLKQFDIILVLLSAYFWETIEHYLEAGLLDARVTYWFQGVEAWDNRLLSDPMMLVFGYLIVRKYPRLVAPARVFSFVWLFVHIFIFPHSMHLQDLIMRVST